MSKTDPLWVFENYGEAAELIDELDQNVQVYMDKYVKLEASYCSLVEFIKNAPVASGVCCCGDSIAGHADPMTCGHVPVDAWDYAVLLLCEEIDRLSTTASN